MYLTYSQHSRADMDIRDIPAAWVEHCVESPVHLEADPDDPMLNLSFLPIYELGGRVLCVVYNHLDNHVVAVFVDRRWKGKL
jgi:hypothetical protein